MNQRKPKKYRVRKKYTAMTKVTAPPLSADVPQTWKIAGLKPEDDIDDGRSYAALLDECRAGQLSAAAIVAYVLTERGFNTDRIKQALEYVSPAAVRQHFINLKISPPGWSKYETACRTAGRDFIISLFPYYQSWAGVNTYTRMRQREEGFLRRLFPLVAAATPVVITTTI